MSSVINIIYKYVGYYFPNETGYDGKFFLEFLAGKKSVNYIIINDNSYYHWAALVVTPLNILQKIHYLLKNIS